MFWLGLCYGCLLCKNFVFLLVFFAMEMRKSTTTISTRKFVLFTALDWITEHPGGGNLLDELFLNMSFRFRFGDMWPEFTRTRWNWGQIIWDLFAYHEICLIRLVCMYLNLPSSVAWIDMCTLTLPEPFQKLSDLHRKFLNSELVIGFAPLVSGIDTFSNSELVDYDENYTLCI